MWGRGASGQLGLGHSRDESLPRQVQGKLMSKRVAHISVGNRHSLAVATDGHLYAWGGNAHGQLGLGDVRVCLTLTLTRLYSEPDGLMGSSCAAGFDTYWRS